MICEPVVVIYADLLHYNLIQTSVPLDIVNFWSTKRLAYFKAILQSLGLMAFNKLILYLLLSL